MFSSDQIETLIRGESIDDDLPFNSQDDASIRSFYEPIIYAAGRRLGLGHRVEWGHYGSGYASFIDAWFYRLDQAGRLSSHAEDHIGIWILLSRTTRYFVIGEGGKSWSAKGGSGYLPSFSGVDEIKHPALLPLVAPLVGHFTAAGLTRLGREDLVGVLDSKIRVSTILGDPPCPPYREFDALFHWED